MTHKIDGRAKFSLRAAGIVSMALLMSGAVACAPEPGNSAGSGNLHESTAPSTTQPSPSATTTPTTAKPSAKPEPAPLVLPACGDLLTVDAAHELSGNEATELLDPETAARLRELVRDRMFGPATVTALASAEAEVHCVWGVPNSGALTQVFIVELAPAQKTALLASLDDSDFVQAQEGAVTTYSLVGEPGVSQQFSWYAFWGDAWIIDLSSTPEPQFGRTALASLIAANPNHVVPEAR